MKRIVVVSLMVFLLAAMLGISCAKEAPAPAPAAPAAPAPAKPEPAPAPAKPEPAPAKPEPAPFSATWRANMHSPEVHGTSAMVRWFAEEVEKRTDGRLKIEMYYSGALGDEKEQLEGLQAGAFEMASYLAFFKPEQCPLWQFNWGAYSATNDFEVAAKVWNELDQMPMLADQIGKFDARHVFWSNTSGPRFLWTVDRQVMNLEDFKGLKISSVGLRAEILKDLGATPVAIASAYDALQKGTLDSIEATASTAFGWKWYELCNYMTRYNFGFSGPDIVMKKSAFDKLPPDIQEIFEGVMADQPAQNAKKAAEDNAKAYDAFKAAGLVIADPPKDQQEKLRKEYIMKYVSTWIDETEAKGQPARELIDTYEELCAKYSK